MYSLSVQCSENRAVAGGGGGRDSGGLGFD